MNRPNFFVVGAPKCGTSALYNHLRAHPEIYMASPKELNFHCTDITSPKFSREDDWYASRFSDVTDEKAIGEASVWYLYSRVAAQNIFDYAPDAKIVAMFRNPIEMVYSYHSQRIWNKTEDISNFGKALDAIPDRKESKRLPQDPYPLETLDYLEIARYSEQVGRYFNLFGRDRVQVIIFDDLKADSAAVHRRVFEFLGVDTDVELDIVDDAVTRNANKQPRSQFLSDMLTSPPAWLRRFGRVLAPNPDRRDRMWRKVRRMNIKWQPRRELSHKVRERLRRAYGEEIRKFSELIGRDLTSDWK